MASGAARGPYRGVPGTGGQGVGAKLVLGPGAQVEEAEAAGHRREADGPHPRAERGARR